ncbi:helicase domino-like isoform X2 [Planococcus citri]|uniref:helicase domino-like isoform X2 n=1 Tax=Planococcus citri TaxID=170843 RepID=UPI0031FA3DC8
MAGGVHASSPGSATVTHQMGHSVRRPEYSIHLNGETTSSTRKRRRSSDAGYQLDSKRACIYNQLLTDMIIEKEKYLYVSLLEKYRNTDQDDFLEFIDKTSYPGNVLPFPTPLEPRHEYLSSEPDPFKQSLRKLIEKDLKKERSNHVVENNSQQIVAKNEASSRVSDSQQTVVKAKQLPNQSGDNSQQIVVKAKQEAYVLQRVAELQKAGLWPEKKLSKVQEPPRTKAHWDYVLEELEWLATDFAQERKWKKAAARKRSRMIQKHFQEREALVLKAAKAAELHKRRIASHTAKMVKLFWSNVEKLVDFKQQTKLKEKRQQALDQHLSFIVDKTEKYSSLVAESMNKSTNRAQSPDENSDAEFEPNQSSSDDEETIEAEEKIRGAEVDHSKEIEMLKRESELPLEDLLNQLPSEYLNNVPIDDKISNEKPIDDDDEYKMEDDESDDETTLLEEEKRQGKVDYKSEIAELQADNNLSIEELMKKYAADAPTGNSIDSNSQSESSSESTAEESAAESDASDNENSTIDNSDDEDDENDEDDDDDDDEDDDDESKSDDSDESSDGLMSLLKDSTLENGDMNEENTDEKIDDVAAIAESIQPKGNTLSSTSVVTKVPFLLKHTLREYQHIGLDWLVTMYERKLNGILADEMGLGKTIQTIALLAHLASDKEDWGPHLIIVPTSVMLNWEMECKKWCPAFKILTYYGNPKERKLKRSGWTKPNTFHVCITSYKLVLQDHHCFRRKKWKYLILDEAQNIKNFKSQRWQRLLNFDSERRLLLTGTPLQNNLMELWSLMHFLMPNLFASHHEFKEWFSNPVTGMIEGNAEYNENIIKRLHKVLRPFLLRRLKTEVEKQLPSKYEHVVMCRLSNRQRYLYDDFMSRAKTKETLSSGNLLSVINVLMQLRKVCNHPNLFEPRPIISPFQMEALDYQTASLVFAALDYAPFERVNLDSLNLRIVDSETELTAWAVHRLNKLRVPRRLIQEIDKAPEEPPPLPNVLMNVRLRRRSSTPASRPLPPLSLLSSSKFVVETSPVCSSANNSIKSNNTLMKGNSKITSYFKTASTLPTSVATVVATSPVTTVSTTPTMFPAGMKTATAATYTVVSNPISAPATGATGSVVPKLRLAQVYRNIVPQDDVNNMAVKTIKPVGNATTTMPISTTNLTFQFKGGTTLNALAPGKICFTTAGSKIPIQATVLRNMLPVSSPLKMNNNNAIVATASGSSQPSIMQTVGGQKTYIALPANSMTISPGQKVILKNVNASDLKAPVIKLPQLAQSNYYTSSNVLVNNAPKTTSVTIPKPISATNCSPTQSNAGSPSSSASFASSLSSASSSGTTTRSRHHHDSSKIKEDSSSLEDPIIVEKRRHMRREKLRILGVTNDRKSSPYVVYGSDVRDSLKITADVASSSSSTLSNSDSDSEKYWKYAGHVNCVNAQYAKHVYDMCYTLTNALSDSVKSIEERIQDLSETFSRFIVYVPAVNARRPSMHVSRPNPSKSWSMRYTEAVLERELTPKAVCLHQVVSKMSTAFPDSRLIQYDCGKLQTLDTLLRRLKAGQHRVLIFTQMARMLDVLETFLTFHGHIYLRLDGSTRIDQRQVLMERFNADKRYFCFILSTRSGGIGVNLTGADTVIFYDSDWNPTMDAQAQDRCHRIGQTRDVHIYRLISDKTVEENILKKANQKKLLGDLAIEGGNFTTAYFKSTTIHDLFNVDLDESDPAKRMSDIAPPEATNSSAQSNGSAAGTAAVATTGVEKSTLNAYETALAAVEDETDVNAAKTAKEEAVAELEEFDENIPLVDNDNADNSTLPTEAEQKVNALLEQLTPIERWALQFMETVDAEWAEEQLAAAEAEIEQQKKEWEMERLAIEQADERSKRRRLEDGSADTEDDNASTSASTSSALSTHHNLTRQSSTSGGDSKHHNQLSASTSAAAESSSSHHSRLRSTKKDKQSTTPVTRRMANNRRSVAGGSGAGHGESNNDTRKRHAGNASRLSV